VYWVFLATVVSGILLYPASILIRYFTTHSEPFLLGVGHTCERFLYGRSLCYGFFFICLDNDISTGCNLMQCVLVGIMVDFKLHSEFHPWSNLYITVSFPPLVDFIFTVSLPSLAILHWSFDHE
jgi:hypothetical protein